MFRPNVGPNLSIIMVDQLKAAGATVCVASQWRSWPIIVEVDDAALYVKYANLNKAGNWFFGFHQGNVAGYCSYVLFLCGEESDKVRTYLVPWNKIGQFLASGTLVAGREYKSHIYPDRDYVMKIVGNPDHEFQMKPFEIYHGSIYSPQFAGTLLQKVRSRRELRLTADAKNLCERCAQITLQMVK